MVWQTRAAQEGVVPLRQIVAVKLPEGGLGTFGVMPSKSVQPQFQRGNRCKPRIETGFTERQRWEIGNRSRRQQRYRDTLVARVAAGDPRNSCQQNVSTLGRRNIAQN